MPIEVESIRCLDENTGFRLTLRYEEEYDDLFACVSSSFLIAYRMPV